MTAISGAYYRAASCRFFKQHRTHLGKFSTGTRHVWKAWRSGKPNWRVDWNHAVGALTAFPVVSPAEARRRWIEFLLHLSSRGIQGEWKARFSAPVTLAYGGGLLRDLRGISVRMRSNRAPRIELHSDLNQPFEPRPNLIWRGLRISVLSIEDFARLRGEVAANGTSDPFAETVWNDRWNNLSAALGMLESFTPHYAAWVRRVFRAVIPLVAPDGVTMSSSDATAPGVIRMSLDHDPVTMGELLVHESAHQYFHLLEHDGPVINGADSTLYWSPFRRADRPIRNILLAYHAFANIVLYYRAIESVLRTGREAIRAAGEIVGRQLMQIDEVLERSPGLTVRGRFVWSLLHQQLQAK